MGISVEGQKCPICGAYIFDKDDLVFCPECGAPHHRDCYNALGHCAFADKHGTDECYKKPESTKQNTTNEQFEKESTAPNARCRFCGEELNANEQVCNKCGRPQVARVYTPFGSPIMLDPLGGVSPNEMIDDIPANEVKDFVVVNTQRYLPRFIAMNDKKKKSWNWAAFLFPYAWFFYRKNYFVGILFFALMLIASLFMLSYTSLMATFPDEVKTSTTLLAKYITENFSNLNLTSVYLASAGVILEIVIRIVAGITGDRIYRKNVLESIRKIKSEENELDESLEVTLRRKGGVNMFLGLIGLFAIDWISMVIYTII